MGSRDASFEPGARELLDAVRDYLSRPRTAVLSSLGPDDAPQQVVLHYLLGQDHVLVNGRADRRWAINLRRDPRVSLIVPDTDQPLHWVGLRGRAECLGEGQAAVQDAMALARRYGEDPSEYASQHRISFRIVPRRVFRRGDPPGFSAPARSA